MPYIILGDYDMIKEKAEYLKLELLENKEYIKKEFFIEIDDIQINVSMQLDNHCSIWIKTKNTYFDYDFLELFKKQYFASAYNFVSIEFYRINKADKLRHIEFGDVFMLIEVR